MRILKLHRCVPLNYRSVFGYGGGAIERPMAILQAMGCDIRVVAPVPFAPFPVNRLRSHWREYPAVSRKEEIDGIPVYHPRYISIPGTLFAWTSGSFLNLACTAVVRRLHLQASFQLVHSHFGFPEGFVGAAIAREYHVPLVITIQATDLYLTSKNSRRCRDLLRRALAAANEVISPTDILARKLEQVYGCKSTVVNYGIDPERVCHSTCSLRSKHDKRLVIMSVCQLMPSKGIDLTLYAFAELLKERDDIVYVIVGGGPDRSRLEMLADSLGVRNHVEFVGHVSHNIAMDYMSICDVFVLPSWQETFGLVYAEAMAQGKVVVGCRGQGISTLIETANAGVLADPKDCVSLKQSLKQLLDNSAQRMDMGKRGREFVLTHLTNEHTALKTLSVYKQSVARFAGVSAIV